MDQANAPVFPRIDASPTAAFSTLTVFKGGVGGGASLQTGAGVWCGRAHGGYAPEGRIWTGGAVVRGVGLAVTVQVAVYVLHRRELLRADRTSVIEKASPVNNSSFRGQKNSNNALLLLVFPVGVLCFNMSEQRRLIQKDLWTVDALQVCSVRQLWVSSQDVFFQLIRLAERFLTVITHVQILLQFNVSSRSLLPSILLTS